MRLVPRAASVTSPASLSTLRCWDTAGLDTGNSSASCPTAIGSRARHSKIARLVGSPSAASAAAPLVSTYRKLQLTKRTVNELALHQGGNAVAASRDATTPGRQRGSGPPPGDWLRPRSLDNHRSN